MAVVVAVLISIMFDCPAVFPPRAQLPGTMDPFHSLLQIVETCRAQEHIL